MKIYPTQAGQAIDLGNFPSTPTAEDVQRVADLLTAELERGEWKIDNIRHFWVIRQRDDTNAEWTVLYGVRAGQRSRDLGRSLTQVTTRR